VAHSDHGTTAWQATVRSLRKAVKDDSSRARRSPTVVAHWEGDSRARIEHDESVTRIGGDGDLNSMQALLAALCACQVDVIAVHAALLDIRIESLSVEATGPFDISSYIGIEDSPGPGFEHIDLRIRLRAPGVSEEQVAHLRRRCEESSPVGDSLRRSVPLHLQLELE
jgi:uncharacterized OsmC-like protein